jgi:hypothetical protein
LTDLNSELAGSDKFRLQGYENLNFLLNCNLGVSQAQAVDGINFPAVGKTPHIVVVGITVSTVGGVAVTL